MSNKLRHVRGRWIFAAAALLAIGLMSGAALAANGPVQPVGSNHYNGHETAWAGRDARDALLARVAEIVGVEQETLTDACGIALDERAAQDFEAIVAHRMGDETLARGQADAISAWHTKRPISCPIRCGEVSTDAARVSLVHPMNYPPEVTTRAGGKYKGAYMVPWVMLLSAPTRLHPRPFASFLDFDAGPASGRRVQPPRRCSYCRWRSPTPPIHPR